MNSNLLKYIPIARLFPLRTFGRRTTFKFLATFGYILRIYGASHVGTCPCGNSVLQLNIDGPLGKKGSRIEIPKDSTIFRHLQRLGNWQIKEVEFLSAGFALGKMSTPRTFDADYLFLDIGAQAGIISLEVLNLSQEIFTSYLVEPLPKHVHAIQMNLLQHIEHGRVKVFDYALGEDNGVATAYTELINNGNTSLFLEAMPESSFEITNVKVVDVSTFAKELDKFSKIVLKSDTQGYDAKILGNLDSKVWKKIQRGLIEVWALPSVEVDDVEKLLKYLADFEYIAWSSNPQEEIGIEHLKNFWLAKTSCQKDLLISRQVSSILHNV